MPQRRLRMLRRRPGRRLVTATMARQVADDIAAMLADNPVAAFRLYTRVVTADLQARALTKDEIAVLPPMAASAISHVQQAAALLDDLYQR